MNIIGAGLAGLIAAHAFPRSTVLEASPEPEQTHKALLRFRSDAVANLTGIEFEPVKVRKAIWDGEKFTQPNVRVANDYSKKCLGRISGERSIWNLEPVTRYIAPENIYEQLLDGIGNRVIWDTKFDYAASNSPVISTAPLPVVLNSLELGVDAVFARSKIDVKRYRIPDCDTHQTVYFPSHDTAMYRTSITGNLLIVEFADFRPQLLGPLAKAAGDPWADEIWSAMGIDVDECEPLEQVSQKYGKIAPIDEGTRRALIAKLTNRHQIYSLGRFATWRNLLLDDVVDDIAVVKRLIHASDYERRLKQ